MAPRPKKEYQEREPDRTGTPYERFEKALKKVIHAPKTPTPKKPREP